MRTPVLLLCLAVSSLVQSAEATRLVPFEIPCVGDYPDAVNVGWLNHRPAGEFGFVTVKDGHFALGNGERIRFLGGGLIRGACFPSHEQATALAKRMGSLGFNLVRVHHIDTSYAPNGFWDSAYKDKHHLDAGQLERFDFVTDALRREGVYLNINLHVSRSFTVADGFPEANKLPSMGKGITIFLPRAIELQKAYARDLLTHRNPYSGLRYVDNPGLAMVEINNEDSLVGTVSAGKFARLPERYEKVLTEHWNRWLAARCPNSAAVNRRWSALAEPLGKEILANGAFAEGGKHWVGENPDVMPVAKVQTEDGGTALDIRCLKPGKLPWTMQLHQMGLSMTDGKPYTVRFRMRSAKPAKVQIVARLDHAHPKTGRYEVVGLNRAFRTTAKWQEFTFTFLARDPSADGNRIGFTFPNEKGEFWLADMSLKPGGHIGGIPEGESLEARTIRRPLTLAEATPAQWRDWIACCCEIEGDYFAEMYRFLKEDLGVKCPVIGTQVSYGGVYGVVREDKMDYADMHAYWQHPRFPGKSWDMKNWRVDNSPMVDVPGNSTLRRLSRHRLVGKPYVVSEYNHPAPSFYASECWPMVSAMGAWQDWDGIVVHNYVNYGPDSWETGRKVGLFDTATSPQKTPFVPAAAVLFRTGAIAPVRSRSVLYIPEPKVPDLLAGGMGKLSDLWQKAGGDSLLMLGQELSVQPVTTGDSCRIDAFPYQKLVFPSIHWQGKEPGKEPLLTADAPCVKIATGAIAERGLRVGKTRFQIGPSRTGYATVALVALDGNPVEVSKRLLLSVGGVMENQDWVWNEAKNMLTSWGKSPTLTEVIPGQMDLVRADGKPLRAYALDGAGKRMQELPLKSSAEERWTLAFGDADTMWYEIVAE
jgi:hypothetical protein